MNVRRNIEILKALSEESRYRIIQVLFEGEKCACEIPYLINRTQSNTSMQLAKLLALGILKSRKDGKKVIYSIGDKKVCGIFKSLGYSDRKLSKCCSTMKEVVC